MNEFKLKHFFSLQTKNILTFKKFFVLNSLQNNSKSSRQKNFFTDNLKYYKLVSVILNKNLSLSVFNNFNAFSAGVGVIVTNYDKLPISKIFNSNTGLNLFFLKLNKVMYSGLQTKNLRTLNFRDNCRELNFSLKNLILSLYTKLSK